MYLRVFSTLARPLNSDTRLRWQHHQVEEETERERAGSQPTQSALASTLVVYLFLLCLFCGSSTTTIATASSGPDAVSTPAPMMPSMETVTVVPARVPAVVTVFDATASWLFFLVLSIAPRGLDLLDICRRCGVSCGDETRRHLLFRSRSQCSGRRILFESHRTPSCASAASTPIDASLMDTTLVDSDASLSLAPSRRVESS